MVHPHDTLGSSTDDENTATDPGEVGSVNDFERAELAEILVELFGIQDASLLTEVIEKVRWESLASGGVLFYQGDHADSASFLLRGRLTAHRGDRAGVERMIGQITRGEIVGESGLLDDRPRNATIRAARDSRLATFTRDDFLSLVDSHPRILLEVSRMILRRIEGSGRREGTASIIGVLVAGGFDSRILGSRLESELAKIGAAELLWPERIERLLNSPGATHAPAGSIGDVELSTLLYREELRVDHLLLEVGTSSSQWSRRVFGLVDRVLVFVPPNPDDLELAALREILSTADESTPRLLCVVHANGESSPTNTDRLLAELKAHQALHIRSGSPTDMARVGRVATGRGNGLVLGGGGARGFAHLGVHRALGELGIPIDIFGGSSIGSTLAVGMADGLDVEAMEATVEDLFSNVLDYTIPVVSLVKGNGIAVASESVFGERRIEDLWRTFFCVSTNLTSSRLHVHRDGSIVHAIRATCSIPGVMPPVPHGDDLLVDGGVMNNLPVDVMRDMTPGGLVLAVDVAPVRGPSAKDNYGLSVSGWQALRGSVMKRTSYPGITSVLLRSMIVGSQMLRDELIDEGTVDCYLDLDLRGVSMLDFDAVKAVAKRGYEQAMPRLEAWLQSREEADHLVADPS